MRFTNYIVIFFLTLSTCISLISCNENEQEEYNILDFGAKNKPGFVNTKYIQVAIDSCSNNGGGVVVIPKGKFITGTIIIKDNVTLLLNKNAELIGSKSLHDYINIDRFTDAVGQERGNCLVGAVNANNIGIRGWGTINGRGAYFRIDSLQKAALKNNTNYDYSVFNKRPFLVRFVKCTNLSIDGVQLKNSASWAMHCFQCKNVSIKNISIHNKVNKNNDGIDLDSSSDVKVEGCHIDTEDDALCFKTTSPIACENIKVKNCSLSSHWGAIKFGTESMGNFTNIEIDSCTIYNTNGGGIKILSVDGANINDIRISNIAMNNVDMPVFIRLGERLRTYRNAAQQKAGSINNISLKNINATVWTNSTPRINPPSAMLITGTKNYNIDSLFFENISITIPGSGKEKEKQMQVPENEANYPEYIGFGILPAYGAYIRHTNYVNLNNVNIEILKEDNRYALWLEDLDKFKATNVTANGLEISNSEIRKNDAESTKIKYQ